MTAPTDPNWLLSTAAQSTAALVAIVGGFLISRVISLSSEKSGLLSRWQQVMPLLAVSKEDLEKFRAEVFETGRKLFMDRHLDDFVLARGVGERAEDIWSPRGMSSEDIDIAYRALQTHIQEAFEIIESMYDGRKVPPVEAAELRADGVEIPVGSGRVYEEVAARVAEGRRVKTPLASFLYFKRPSILMGMSDVAIQRRDQAITKRNELESAVDGYRLQIHQIKQELQHLGRPKGLIGGFLVLTGFGLVGIVLPLSLMAFRPVADVLWVRLLVILGFAAGFTALVAYIFFAVRGLRRDVRPASNAPAPKVAG